MNQCKNQRSPIKGFSLVEVVLAIGVLSLAVVALLGLFGPTISSVKQVVDNNVATAAVSKINTHIQYGMSWDEVVSALPAGSGSIFYVWNNQTAEDQPITMEISDNAGDLALDQLVGTPMVVTIERGMQTGTNTYDFANVDTEGYMPILVKIYSVDAANIGNYSFETVDGVSVLQSSGGDSLEPIFSYTTAKNRSI